METARIKALKNMIIPIVVVLSIIGGLMYLAEMNSTLSVKSKAIIDSIQTGKARIEDCVMNKKSINKNHTIK